MPLIQANQVTKSFGTGEIQVNVLRGIDLQINAGEFVAVMGPSGSGKSTFLSILGGIEPPTTGSIFLEGTDLASLSDDARTKMRRRRIGFIFQAFNLISTLTALENVCLPMELDGVARSEAADRAMEALSLVEMNARAKHIPSKMSGGEQQRVAIARALAIKPAIILADEPTGNLDSRQGTRVTGLLRDLVKQYDQTIVMVTHDSNVAHSASRLVLLRDGAIESDRPQPGWLESGVAV